MFKTEVVDSRNIRKTSVFKIVQIILIVFLLFFFALSFHIFGQDSALENFFRINNEGIIQPIALSIIIIAVVFQMTMRARSKNPRILGSVELDENDFKFSGIDNTVKSFRWSELEGVTFEFFSTCNRNNPRGCFNYLTMLRNLDQETYEIIIENSLVKSDFGEILRVINKKVPVRIKYSVPLKMILRDNDFKLR